MRFYLAIMIAVMLGAVADASACLTEARITSVQNSQNALILKTDGGQAYLIKDDFLLMQVALTAFASDSRVCFTEYDAVARDKRGAGLYRITISK